MRPVPPSGWPFRSFTWSRRRQTGRFLSLSTVDWLTSRLSSSVRVIRPGMASAGVRWCVVFQVVKTAQSRERAGRTLFTALSQLLWRDKGRAVWFSLGENHEKACRFPDFLQRSTGREQRCATFFAESRMQFGSSNNISRKSSSVCTNREIACAVLCALRRRPRGAQECCGQV